MNKTFYKNLKCVQMIFSNIIIKIIKINFVLFLTFFFFQSCGHNRKKIIKFYENEQKKLVTLKEKSNNLKNLPISFVFDKCKIKDYRILNKYFDDKYYGKNKDTLKYWSELGTCHYLMGELFKARLYFKYALNKKKGVKELNNYAIIEGKRAKSDKAYKILLASLGREKRKNSKILYNLILLLVKSGHLDLANQYLGNLKGNNSLKDSHINELINLTYLLQGKIKKLKEGTRPTDLNLILLGLGKLKDKKYKTAYNYLDRVRDKTQKIYTFLYKEIEKKL